MTMSLKPQNILCHRISESEVIPVVCDNIGESTLIPLATWSKWCCLRKQERLWKRFIAQPALAIALQKICNLVRAKRWPSFARSLIQLVLLHKRLTA
ncbi:protein [Escherichia coli]|nr:protein [Escherichia coli]